MIRISSALIAAALLLPAYAQERNVGPATYKVEFNIRDGSDAASRTVRHYTLLMQTGHKSLFRVGNRVPVASGSFQPGTGGVGINPLVNTQYTYLDIGVNIECVINEVNGHIEMQGNLDFSTISKTEAPPNAANPPNPTVVQTRLDLLTTMEPGKATAIAAIDDPVTTRHFQVEAIVTRPN
ncbi:MAG TPA: hypothetical protein VG456_11510 [Candidatus Sulfopaludibacter sp.]|jgi:hypothetical protein|nr:hypothetical protein [Candidatus Sulfopaludibacter sp.]